LRRHGAALRRRLAQQKRRAGGRVDLHAVVHLEDLDVEVLAERGRRLAHQARKQVHPERHVAGLDDAGVPRRRLEALEVGLRQPRRADDVDDRGLRREIGVRDARLGRGEVEDAVRLREHGQGIVGDHDAALACPGKQPGVLPEGDGVRAFQGAREPAAVGRRDGLDEHASHAARRADDHEPHLSHGSLPRAPLNPAAGRRSLR
jgi:hypothetical protein